MKWNEIHKEEMSKKSQRNIRQEKVPMLSSMWAVLTRFRFMMSGILSAIFDSAVYVDTIWIISQIFEQASLIPICVVIRSPRMAAKWKLI